MFIHIKQQNVVRKIERQYADVGGAEAEVLRVANEVPVETFLRNFVWDYARYRYQVCLIDIIVEMVAGLNPVVCFIIIVSGSATS